MAAAANGGEALAQFNMALVSGPPGNIEKIDTLAEQGNPNAQLWVIRTNAHTSGMSSEVQAQARAELEAISKLDVSYQHEAISGGKWPLAAEAAFFIAEDYLTSPALYPADMEQALVWLIKAADLGQPQAMFKLGTRYQYGLGVELNMDIAKAWLKKSADAGWRQAREELDKLD